MKQGNKRFWPVVTAGEKSQNLHALMERDHQKPLGATRSALFQTTILKGNEYNAKKKKQKMQCKKAMQ